MPNQQLCLGIESTADDFSIGIATTNGTILANQTNSYIPSQGGIHPREAAQHHAQTAPQTLAEALKKANIKPTQLNLIAFSQGPGLGPSLRTGATIARALATYLKLPLIGVNHSIAHIEIGKLTTHTTDPLTLYASGGNTLITAYAKGHYRIFGETLDIALGNLLDVFAREAQLTPKPGNPLGAQIETLATQGKTLIKLPYLVKGMDLSLSGLLTAATTALQKGTHNLPDLCYSLQEHAFGMVTEITERALAHTEKPQVLLTGGVAANKRLQTMLQTISEEHHAEFQVVPQQYASDNGAMIAWTGILAYTHGQQTPIEESYVHPKWRPDKVQIPWIQ